MESLLQNQFLGVNLNAEIKASEVWASSKVLSLHWKAEEGTESSLLRIHLSVHVSILFPSELNSQRVIVLMLQNGTLISNE